MIRSMTAFGRCKKEYPERDVTVEMRSVNSRFFDFNIRLPRAYACLEDRIRTYVQKNAVARAKVDLYLTVEEHSKKDGAPILDAEYTAEYLKALYALRDAFGLRDDISVMSVNSVYDISVFFVLTQNINTDFNVGAFDFVVYCFTDIMEQTCTLCH